MNRKYLTIATIGMKQDTLIEHKKKWNKQPARGTKQMPYVSFAQKTNHH